MPREIFPLSDATQDTLTDNVKAMMRGWNKCKTHIYNILDETTQDPFPEFQSMYRGALKGGLSTSHWDTELEFDRDRYGKTAKRPDVFECFGNELHKQNALVERYFEAIKDGELSLAEIDDLENRMIDCRDAINENVQALKLKRLQLEKKGPIRAASVM